MLSAVFGCKYQTAEDAARFDNVIFNMPYDLASTVAGSHENLRAFVFIFRHFKVGQCYVPRGTLDMGGDIWWRLLFRILSGAS